jgi:two-component system response regulator
MSSTDLAPVEILLVEDNPADILITREAFAQFNGNHHFHVVEDGEAALAFLRQEGRYAGMPRPDLVLLDLNLPGKNGREVLTEIKSDPLLKIIPVIVLTTSNSENDVLFSYNQYASSYIIKPMGFENFTRAVAQIHSFWISLVRLPHGPGHA